MEAVINKIADYFRDFISGSLFMDPNYYKGLFSKYFTVGGFIIGFIFVLLVYFSSSETQEKTGFFKVLPIIAVLNSCSVLTDFINELFDQGYQYDPVGASFNAPDNIISGFILTLIISSCYRQFGGRAFLFGVATHSALMLLNFAYLDYIEDGVPILHMFARIALIGFTCTIMSHRKYFFTSWIWYFVFHIIIRIIVFFLPMVIENYIGLTPDFHVEYTVSGAVEFFSRFWIDAAFFVAILLISIIFEKGVLRLKPAKKAAAKQPTM